MNKIEYYKKMVMLLDEMPYDNPEYGNLEKLVDVANDMIEFRDDGGELMAWFDSYGELYIMSVDIPAERVEEFAIWINGCLEDCIGDEFYCSPK